ncbi:MAG: hypothetical protein ACYC3X_06410 [Pirellulaceae bacterium]
MTVETPNDVLNRLLVIHTRSLPIFLTFALPWWKDEDGRVADMLSGVAQDQLRIADRIGKLIVDHGGTAVSCQFPDRFSTLHDLAFDYLLAELIRYQDRTVAAIEKCASRLAGSPMVQALAQEACELAKSHRDTLSSLQCDLVAKLA